MSGATEENMSSASRLNAKFTEWRVIWDKHRMTDKSLVLARVVSRCHMILPKEVFRFAVENHSQYTNRYSLGSLFAHTSSIKHTLGWKSGTSIVWYFQPTMRFLHHLPLNGRYWYRQPFPLLYVWLLPLSFAVSFDLGTVPCASVMVSAKHRSCQTFLPSPIYSIRLPSRDMTFSTYLPTNSTCGGSTALCTSMSLW